MADKPEKPDKNAKRPIIVVKRVKKVVGGGHHGGAWKVAYADFVTAMMAFFLLMWLLNVATEEQLSGIADYFKPTMSSTATTGADGVMGGMTMATEGAMTSDKNPTVNVGRLADNTEMIAQEQGEDGFEDDNEDPAKKLTKEQFEQAKAAEEEKMFEKAEAELKQAIETDPSLKDLAKHLIIDMTPEGLRIQIVDQKGRSMFPLGQVKMYDETYALLAKVTQVITKLPNKLSVRGHTDGVPYGDSATYDNWNLSADRANASRQAMEKAGLPAARMAIVAGKADTEHLFPKDPNSPQNRRISIVLLREHKFTPPKKLGEKK
jgi:chemotaxis protein MotB